MSDLTNSLAHLVAALGIIVPFPAYYLNAPKVGMGLALDFWLAAGLLKLSGSPSWQVIVSVAAIVVVRKLVAYALSLKSLQTR